MAQSFVRSCRNLKANSNIVSLSCPPAMMAIADAKKAWNEAEVDGETRVYRPDVTLFVNDAIAANINQALADGKSLALEVKDIEVPIEKSAKGTYFIKGEAVLADSKHLRFIVSTPQSAEFSEDSRFEPAQYDDAPFN